MLGLSPPFLAVASPLLFAFIVSLLLTPVVRRVAVGCQFVAPPRADRWHSRPIAISGGVAIVGAVFLGAVWLGLSSQLIVLLAAGALAFGVGLVDDYLSIKPATKFIAAIGLASLLMFFGFRLQWSGSLTLDMMLTMFWIVGITNAFNLLDNMDGLCAGIAIIVGGFILIHLTPLSAVSAEAQFTALLIGAVAGFLVYNFHPASIFMGDSGSLFIGLMISALALVGRSDGGGQSSVLSVVLAPVLVLLIPIFDTTLVTVSRLLSGRSAAQGGRDHFSHRLVAIGLSERYAVAVLWGLAVMAGLTGVVVQRVNLEWSGLMAALFIIGMVLFSVYLANVRVYEDADAPQLRNRNMTPLVFGFMYKRRVAEVLLDVCLVSVCYYSAYRLRFGDAELVQFFPGFLESLPIVIGLQMATFFVVGVYRGLWRRFSLMDGVVIGRAVLVGTGAIVMTIVFLNRFENYSRGVFIIYGALLMLLVTGSRASFRLIGEFAQRRRRDGLRLVVYGAGAGGSLALRELFNHPTENYRLLGFVDDDPHTHRTQLQGYPVLGGYDGLVTLVRGGNVDAIVISVRLMDVARLRQLETLCIEHSVRLARLHVDLTPLVAVS